MLPTGKPRRIDIVPTTDDEPATTVLATSKVVLPGEVGSVDTIPSRLGDRHVVVSTVDGGCGPQQAFRTLLRSHRANRWGETDCCLLRSFVCFVRLFRVVTHDREKTHGSKLRAGVVL